jgi:hypothetical protein
VDGRLRWHTTPFGKKASRTTPVAGMPVSRAGKPALAVVQVAVFQRVVIHLTNTELCW